MVLTLKLRRICYRRVSVVVFLGRVGNRSLLVILGRPPVFDRHIQHHGDHDDGRQERGAGQQQPMMGDVLDVCVRQSTSLPGGSRTHPDWVPIGGRGDHMTFVQVHPASLAWAPFNAGCDEPGAMCVPRAWTGQDKDLKE